MEFDRCKNHVGVNTSDSDFEHLLSQCGLRAVVVLNSFFSFGDTDTDIYGDSFWDISQTGVMDGIIEELKPGLLKRITQKGRMDCEDILDVMQQTQPARYPDFRFDNQISRDVKGKLFFSNLCGITALKFEGTDSLHWAVLFNGAVFPLIERRNRPTGISYNSMGEMRKDIKGFDGFGNTIIYRSKEDVKILERYAKCSQTYCQVCIRKKWCKSNELL